MSAVLRYCLLLLVLLFLTHPLKSDDENKLFNAINNYRVTSNVPALIKNKNAECLADEIAEQLEDQPCIAPIGVKAAPAVETQFSNYPKPMTKCGLNLTSTRDGLIMPACFPDDHDDTSMVISSFVSSRYSRFLNATNFTGAGVGKEGDWVVVVLSTSTPMGNFESNNAVVAIIGLIPVLLCLFVAFALPS
ncbi:hypothetical protein GIB67_029089 [Kingdonia uniflora]|uniref:Uncharacterized GPI-anchored protein At5g19230-like domain-containing protein n=1 Tax=Kingdonia uniflora TaxID=39325 RepID=A0A7J7N712_9MAGN|nr:hypothetical protein GIB67_029089 [Kingdonia uniflora]